MRRKAKTELGTFSASAIDLFASALGAFIIITVVLFPYFPNLSPDPLKAIIEQLREEKQGLEAQVADLNDQNSALTDQNNSLQGQVTAQATTIQQQQGQIASANAQAAAAQQAANQAQANAQALTNAANDKDRQIADLQGQLDGAAFIGIEPEHDNIQIVIDYSGSTLDYIQQIDSAVELIVDRLNVQEDALRITTFAQQPSSVPQYTYWPSANGYQNPMTAADKTSAVNFVASRRIDSDARTPTFEVMSRVISGSEPSSIILITDGVPTGVNSKADMAARISSFTASNAGRHQVNIIAIGEFIEGDIASSIVPLASQNGGVLVALP